MDKQIEPAVQERIRALCKQVTVAYDLDAEIQEELYGHMEDKLLAYLAGEEELSSEDAFILVREHFGNPEVLKEILQAVHESGSDGRAVPVSLPRRLTTALVAMTMISVPIGLIGHAVYIAVGLLIMHSNAYWDTSYLTGHIGLWLPVVPHLLSSILLWSMLVRWQRRLSEGQRPWFVRWPSYQMWAVLGVALIVFLSGPNIVVSILPTLAGGEMTSVVAGIMVLLAAWSISGMAWLWWSDRPPHPRRGVKSAILSFLLLLFLFSFCRELLPTVFVTDEQFALHTIPHQLATGSLFGTDLHWTIQWQQRPMVTWPLRGSGFHGLLFWYWFKYLFVAAATLLGYVLYTSVRGIRRGNVKSQNHGQVVA